MYGTAPNSQQSPSEYIVALQRQPSYDSVGHSLKAQHERQKELYNRRVHWQGPFKVVKNIFECTYRVQALIGERK